jgi:diguanylate cyclase (GGDEF)-like protein
MLQEQMAELQTKAASLEFTNFSMMGELERLEDMATTDALTGLPNIASIRQVLDHSLLLDAKVSVIMMDIDHFKSHNDEHGHQHGDEVLKTVAQVMKGQLRTDEAIGRYGGEEFIIVLPNCASDVAIRIAERLRRSLEEFEWPVKAVTASFGISTRAVEFKVADELIAEADEALYASKRNGRNRVTLGGLNSEAA